ETMPRQASDERISVGRKCLRANVLLPEPLGPIRTTRDNLGIVMFMVMRYSARLLRTPGLFNQSPATLARVVPALFGQPSGCDLPTEQEPGGVEPAVLARGRGVGDDPQPGTVGVRVGLKNLDHVHQ